MDVPEKMLTREEVAALLKVLPVTIRRWADGGKIRFERTPRGKLLIPESVAMALYEGRHQDAAPRPQDV